MRSPILQHQGCGCGCGEGGGGQGSRDWVEAPDDALVCPCLVVTKAQVVEAIGMGATTAPLVKTLTGLGRRRECDLGHRCLTDLQAMLNLYAPASLASRLKTLAQAE